MIELLAALAGPLEDLLKLFISTDSVDPEAEKQALMNFEQAFYDARLARALSQPHP